MDLGFETIGNATLLIHDRKPLLVTDPWIEGSAYFGSWSLSHVIPPAQRDAIDRCSYVWLSHGHPDHLSFESLELLRDKTLLLPDHYGARIAEGLREAGFKVEVLPDAKWIELSDRCRVMCVSDYNQDSVLMVDIGGTLVVNANDAADRGGGDLLRRTAAQFENSFLLCLTGHGDADMINVHDEAGRRLLPALEDLPPLGPSIDFLLQHFGLKNFVPFSSMHVYQRSDSLWANERTTPLGAHSIDFPKGERGILPAYVSYDVLKGEYTEIRPDAVEAQVLDPSVFGDSWSDELETEDVELLRSYFQRIEHLKTFLGFVRFRVGGREHTIDIAPGRFERGLTFETPRNSLLIAVREEVFDDLLIGNYMKTTLNGSWPVAAPDALYPDFTPYLAKYSDNGRARTAPELGRYFEAYRQRGFVGTGLGPFAQAAARSMEAYLEARAADPTTRAPE